MEEDQISNTDSSDKEDENDSMEEAVEKVSTKCEKLDA